MAYTFDKGKYWRSTMFPQPDYVSQVIDNTATPLSAVKRYSDYVPFTVWLYIDDPPDPLTLFVNPANIRFKESKVIAEQFTRNGFVSEHWGDDPTTIDASGYTGGTYTKEHGLFGGPRCRDKNVDSRINSAAYQELRALLNFYKNNGRNFGFGGGAIPARLSNPINPISEFSDQSQFKSTPMTDWEKQVAQYARDAGFPESAIPTAVAIAWAESHLDPTQHNPNPPDDSYGLWQINMIGDLGPARRKEFGITSNEQLLDPATNARAAFQVYKDAGYKFTPWTTFTHGKYLPFMKEPTPTTTAPPPQIVTPSSSIVTPATSIEDDKRRIRTVGYVVLSFDSISYFGHFDSFTYKDSAELPHLFEYSFSFTALDTQTENFVRA